jgi:hypothetical protein
MLCCASCGIAKVDGIKRKLKNVPIAISIDIAAINIIWTSAKT